MRLANCYYSSKPVRERVPLMLCETEDAGLLREAAEQKHDEKILIDIRGRDCAAIEV